MDKLVKSPSIIFEIHLPEEVVYERGAQIRGPKEALVTLQSYLRRHYFNCSFTQDESHLLVKIPDNKITLQYTGESRVLTAFKEGYQIINN